MKEEQKQGTEHPLSILANEAYQAFTDMGFEIVLGPEVESEWHNFDILNVPPDHPARDMQDTFYVKNGQSQFVLRTHATNSSARKLEEMSKNGQSQGAYISIGKVFRNESTDATHEMQFYQVDGI